jgi:3-oxoacyl-[acyl-carrier-protein] synthase III
MTDFCKTVIESIGTYLPPKEVSTDEVIKGCVRELHVPLERLTGIRTRRRAGESEFAIDLAEKAVRDCLSRSSFRTDEVEVIVSTNISRWDGPNQVYFEPATSVRLKRRLGLAPSTLAIDISNACAGMWTGVFLVESLIRTGAIRCGVVVSGEYITHLIDTAQKEVRDYMDSQLASLTLGDAGAAVTLARGTSEHTGLIDFDLYTLSKLARFCIAKPTNQAHGGASMHTDSIRVTESVLPHAAKHAWHVLRQNQWALDQIQHIIPHQTSELTMKAGIREIRRLLDHDFSDRLINNLRHRGNTSSNAHFVALHDAIQELTINSGDSVVFCISGSGQSTGTALYIMDNLPDRMRSPAPRASATSEDQTFVLPVQLEIESCGFSFGPGKGEPDTVQLIAAAAEECLGRSKYDRAEIDVFIAACTYRSEFLMEPAIAALAAGALHMNDDREPEDAGKTLAFDITNGDVGFLKSVHMASELVRAGRARRVMVAASEVENNIDRCPEHLLGLRAMASVIMLRESEGESGFLNFGFADFAEFDQLRRVHAGWHENGRRIYLTCDEQPNVLAVFLDCLLKETLGFLDRSGVNLDEIDWFIPSQHSTEFVAGFAAGLSIDRERVVDMVDLSKGNPSSSLFPLALAEGRHSGRFQPGHLVLAAIVCPGVQVGCALYRV